MFTNVIDKVNKIYDSQNLPISLKYRDFDAITIKQIPKTEILRRGARENHTGVLNNSLYDRANPANTNTNAATHYFLSSSVVDLFPQLSNNTSNLNYVLSVPVQIPFMTLHLMLNNLPTGYYHSTKINYLGSTFPISNNTKVMLSTKLTSGPRIMFASKEYINKDKKDFFLELKYTQFAEDYLILLKKRKSFEYYLLFIPKDLGDAEYLSTYSNQLFSNNSNTPVPLSYFQNIGGKNLIVSGAPGTGKSRWVKDNYEVNGESKRITFHPEYTYNEFVGSLKPISDPNNIVKYGFVPGPFPNILLLAYSNPSKRYSLIIEEINRANTAAVFGDIFQILDRDIDGFSEYGIDNEDIINYINHGLTATQLEEVKLPPNLNIIATMNSADQGVFQMDTAFKRRWNFHYIPITFDDWHNNTCYKYNNRFITIKNFITILNEYLSKNQVLQINEDRLVGPYFLKQQEAEKWFDKSQGYDYYKKMLLYLWDDIARIDRDSLFKNDYYQFSLLCEGFENGDPIFIDPLQNELNTKLFNTSTDAIANG